ncbi:YgjV family protein [Streptomyces scabiei]
MMLVGTSMWIAHNIMVVSPIAVVMECLFLTSNIVGLYRFYRDKPFLTKAA